MKGKYANIIIEIAHEKLDRPFQYRIPERLQGKISPGICVIIPFGNGNKQIRGYVIEVTDTPEFETERMKEIAGRAEGSLAVEEKLICLAAWMREHYGSTMIQALKTVLPVRKKVRSLPAPRLPATISTLGSTFIKAVFIILMTKGRFTKI